MNLKSLLLSGALALGSQNVLAAKPLPCPSGSPIHDQVGVVKNIVRDRIEKRLLTLDREKFHQVVIITVNSPEEYGYSSFAELGADTINKCGIGYRGENTGVIVWYGKEAKKPYFISTSSGVSEYITDATIQKLGRGSIENCEKFDTSCRLDDITKGLEKIISQHFDSQKKVQVIQDGIQQHDKIVTSNQIEEILNMLGIGGMVLLVVGGGIHVQKNREKSKRREELKKKILELSIKIEQEKPNYPKWFVHSHINRVETQIQQLQAKTDLELDTICKSSSQYHQMYAVFLGGMEENLALLSVKYEQIMSGVKIKKQEIESTISQIQQTYSELLSQGFKLPYFDLSIPPEGKNPELALDLYSGCLEALSRHVMSLSKVTTLYQDAKGFNKKVKSNFATLKEQHGDYLKKYEAIFGQDSVRFSLNREENQIQDIMRSFPNAYEQKDIPKLSEYMDSTQLIFSKLKDNISQMQQKISWYEGLRTQISHLQKQVKEFTPSPEYEKNAREYRQESGKTRFEGYNMSARLKSMSTSLDELQRKYHAKQDLSSIPTLMAHISNEVSLMAEYVGLGIIVGALVKKRLQEEAAETAKKAAQEKTSTSNDTGWSPGGGGGGDGGGSGFE